MLTTRRVIAPTLFTAVTALVYFVTAAAASAQTYLPEGDDGGAHAPVPASAVTSTGSPIWQFVAVAIAAAAIALTLTLALTRFRQSHHQLSLA